MGFRSLITTLVLSGAFGLSAQGAFACSDQFIDLRGDWGQAKFSVEIADDATERGRGLMFRESMPRTAGMLFVYQTPQHATFWMKNTLIPLDMIFADASGTVTHIHSNAIPHDLTAIDGGPDVLYVLEINGGLAELYGISEGSHLRHPQIVGKNVVWLCENQN